MSDKENTDVDENYKTPRTYSSASNISSAARSIIGHVLDGALETIDNDIDGRDSISVTAISMVDEIMDSALNTLNDQESINKGVTSVARSMIDHVMEGAMSILNKQLSESDGNTGVSETDTLYDLSDVVTSSVVHDTLRPIKLMSPDTLEDTERDAFMLVDRSINSAIRQLEHDMQGKVGDHSVAGRSDAGSLGESEIPVANIVWPTIGRFDEFIGEKKIDEFIVTWNLGYEWLHCINYLGVLETRYDWRYKYGVRFSIPTCRKPIPRASASVYFTIVASKIKPPEIAVDVFYVLESMQLVHRPGEYIFCELWLRRIIDQKNSLMQIIDF